MSSQVRVVIRFRPQNAVEKEHGGEPTVTFNSGTELEITGATTADAQKVFTYDDVFNPTKTQEEIFAAVGLPTIDNVLKGYNGTILAYGQTGSGKTHSMLGPEGGTADALTKESPHYAQRGIIPRLVEALFEKLDRIPKAEVTWKVTVSVFELYKEGIHDLLTEATNVEYRIREDTIGGRGVYVENLYAKQCLSASELLEAIKVGVSKRKVASTKSNETSSRSHSVTVINVEQINHVQEDITTVARLNLVDLAGSERQSKTQAGGERLKEAQMINLSLTLLGNVIYKLTDGKSTYIPYRDSKLTRILQDSFGGNSVTTLMCHCSPAQYNKDETVTTLRFASRAKMIRNKPRVNRELSAKELQLAYAQALERIRLLEERLEIHDKIGVAPSPTKRSAAAAAAAERAREDGTTTPEPQEDLRGMIDSLMKTIEELKQELFEKQKMLDAANEQVEFYKKRAAESEEEMQRATQKVKKEAMLYERRLKDLEAQLASQSGGGGGGYANGKKPTTPTGSSSSRNMTDVGERNRGPAGATRGGLTRTGSRVTATRRASGSDASSSPVVLEAPETLTALATLTTPTTPTTAPDEPSQREVELLLRITKMEDEMSKMRKERETRAHRESELTSQLQRVSVTLEETNAARDQSEKELDAVRKLLQAKEKQNAQMKRILDELQIDVDDYEFQLGDANARARKLETEAEALNRLTNELKATQDQQEYCDMAQCELVVKLEDLDAIENEINVMQASTIHGDVFAASKMSCLGTLEQIEAVMTTISSKLSASKFNTSNLEGSRLNLINDCTAAMSRCAALRTELLS